MPTAKRKWTCATIRTILLLVGSVLGFVTSQTTTSDHLITVVTTEETPIVVDGGFAPTLETYSDFTTPVPPNNLPNVNKAAEEVLKSIGSTTAPKQEEQVSLLKSLESAIESNSGQDLSWKGELKAAIIALPPITPSIQKPVNATPWLRFQVKLEVFLRNHLLSPTESYKHAASSEYPGQVTSSPSTYSVSIPLDKNSIYHTLKGAGCTGTPEFKEIVKNQKLSCTHFCSTGFYAVPGSTLSVSVASSGVHEAVVRIGHFEHDTSIRDIWHQYPNLKAKARFKTSLDYPIAFGGIVYIGHIKGDVDVENVTIQLSGVVKSPSFFLEAMTLVDWREEVKHINAPWGDLVSEQMTLSFPQSVIRNVSDPEELLIHWERIVDGINEVTATSYKKGREHIAFSRDLPNPDPESKMVPGKPILAVEGVIETVSKWQNLWSKSQTMHGLLHALGHYHDFIFLRLGGGAKDMTNEIIADYVNNIVHVMPIEEVRDEYYADNVKKVMQNYIGVLGAGIGIKYEEFHTSGASKVFYYDILRHFGWISFQRMAEKFKNYVFKGDEELKDDVLLSLSEITQLNLAPYLESWGIKPSAKTKDKVSKWSDPGFRAVDMLTMAVKDIAVDEALGLAKTLTGVEGKSPKEGEKKDEQGEGPKNARYLRRKTPRVARTTTTPQPDRELLFNDVITDVRKDEEESPIIKPVTDDPYKYVFEPRGLELPDKKEQQRILEMWSPPGQDWYVIDQLLAGVTEIPGEFLSGRLLVVGGKARAILAGTMDSYRGVVVAASIYGDGHMVLFGSSGFLIERSGRADEYKFLANCVMFTGSYMNPKATHVVGVQQHPKNPRTTAKLKKLLTEGWLKVKDLNDSQLAVKENIKGLDLVIIPWGERITEEAVKVLDKYVKGGGGLIVALDSNKIDSTTLLTLPVQKLAASASVTWTTGEVEPPSDQTTFNASTEWLSHLTIADIGDEFLEMLDHMVRGKVPSGNHEQEDFIMDNLKWATDIFTQGDLQWDEEIKKKYKDWQTAVKEKYFDLEPLNPTKQKPINVTKELKFRLSVEAFVREYVFGEYDHYVHPSAIKFPGPAPIPDATKTYTVTLQRRRNETMETLVRNGCYDMQNQTVQAFAGDWGPTGFYASPGYGVKVKIVSPNVTGFAVLVGRFEDVEDRAVWEKYPSIKTRFVFPGKREAKLHSAFGGSIVMSDVLVPAATTNITIELTGAVEATHFFLGQTQLTDWSRQRQLEAPWGMMTNPSLQIKFPLAVIKTIDNPEELMIQWKRMIDAVSEFHGLPYGTNRETINFDTQISIDGALMTSGHVAALMETAETAANVRLLLGSSFNQKAFLHELGHNHDNEWWALNGGYQKTNEINIEYVMGTLQGWRKDKIRFYNEPGYIVETLTSYFNNGTNYTLFHDWNINRIFWYDIHRNFGWYTFFRMRDRFKNVRPGYSDDERRDYWLIYLSRVLKRNMRGYLESWGIYSSLPAQAEVAMFPSSKYSAQLLVEQMQRRLNCSAAIESSKSFGEDIQRSITQDFVIPSQRGLEDLKVAVAGAKAKGKKALESLKKEHVERQLAREKEMIQKINGTAQQVASHLRNATDAVIQDEDALPREPVWELKQESEVALTSLTKAWTEALSYLDNGARFYQSEYEGAVDSALR